MRLRHRQHAIVAKEERKAVHFVVLYSLFPLACLRAGAGTLLLREAGVATSRQNYLADLSQEVPLFSTGNCYAAFPCLIVRGSDRLIDEGWDSIVESCPRWFHLLCMKWLEKSDLPGRTCSNRVV